MNGDFCILTKWNDFHKELLLFSILFTEECLRPNDSCENFMRPGIEFGTCIFVLFRQEHDDAGRNFNFSFDILILIIKHWNRNRYAFYKHCFNLGLRYYIIDLRALLFMFNLSQAYNLSEM